MSKMLRVRLCLTIPLRDGDAMDVSRQVVRIEDSIHDGLSDVLQYGGAIQSMVPKLVNVGKAGGDLIGAPASDGDFDPGSVDTTVQRCA
ncbi:MAG: hypothetical protein GC191_08935 [Azospirillum sp.]|nr:hypothetical protein [Azospirillum sp.]